MAMCAVSVAHAVRRQRAHFARKDLNGGSISTVFAEVVQGHGEPVPGGHKALNLFWQLASQQWLTVTTARRVRRLGFVILSRALCHGVVSRAA